MFQILEYTNYPALNKVQGGVLTDLLYDIEYIGDTVKTNRPGVAICHL